MKCGTAADQKLVEETPELPQNCKQLNNGQLFVIKEVPTWTVVSSILVIAKRTENMVHEVKYHTDVYVKQYDQRNKLTQVLLCKPDPH